MTLHTPQVEINNVHKQDKPYVNKLSLSGNHWVAPLTWCPSDSVWSRPRHPSAAHLWVSIQTLPHVSSLLSSGSATRPGGLKDRWTWPDRTRYVIPEEGQGGWAKNTCRKGPNLQSSCPAPPQLGLGTRSHYLSHYDSHRRKPKVGNETERLARQPKPPRNREQRQETWAHSQRL